jgi:putative transposase
MEMAKIIRKSYKFRIYPSKSQVAKLEMTLDLCRELYNAGLQERRDAWKLERKYISYYDQQKQLPEIKKVRGDLNSVYSQVLQDVLNRLDKTYKAFFSRVQKGVKAG